MFCYRLRIGHLLSSLLCSCAPCHERRIAKRKSCTAWWCCDTDGTFANWAASKCIRLAMSGSRSVSSYALCYELLLEAFASDIVRRLASTFKGGLWSEPLLKRATSIMIIIAAFRMAEPSFVGLRRGPTPWKCPFRCESRRLRMKCLRDSAQPPDLRPQGR